MAANLQSPWPCYRGILLVLLCHSAFIVYEINHIWTAEMKWKWRNDCRSERNLFNCVKKPEKNSGLQRGDFFHRNIWTHNWPAPSVSGFIAQLIEHRTGNQEVTGSNPVEVMNFFQASLRNWINCVHCDDHFFIFGVFFVGSILSVLYLTIDWRKIRDIRKHDKKINRSLNYILLPAAASKI